MIFNNVLICLDYENYYPKNKKEIPKGGEKKSGSKGVSQFNLLNFFFTLLMCVG